MGRVLIVLVAALTAADFAAIAAPRVRAVVPSIRLIDLNHRPVDPFRAAAEAAAIVFLFASVDCPISNRYAPVVQRLYERFSPEGVAFWLVYPNPAESAEAIGEHVKAFGYPVPALRDPRHELVKIARAAVTPEAAVFDRTRSLAYRGRLDDRYVSLGVARPVPTRHDLADAIAAILAGRPVHEPVTPAVGCFISDFVR